MSRIFIKSNNPYRRVNKVAPSSAIREKQLEQYDDAGTERMIDKLIRERKQLQYDLNFVNHDVTRNLLHQTIQSLTKEIDSLKEL